MDICFKHKKLAKACHDDRTLQKQHGTRRARLIRRRLDELRAATSLAVLRTLPQARCHELTGARAGQLSVDLDDPYRLIFVPAEEAPPCKPDGGLDWHEVTAIMVLAIENTHG